MANTSASWDQGAFDPSQTYDNLLQPVSGYIMNQSLETTGKPVAGADWKAGSVVSIQEITTHTVRGRTVADIVVKAGCADDEMPLFARGGAEDFDTKADAGNAIGRVASLLPATGGFEIQTTEYDQTEIYDANDFLTASDGDAEVKKSPANYNDNIIIGQVSKGVVEGQYGQSLLQFWTMNIPKVQTS